MSVTSPTASADERERPHLLSVAYRMLGGRADGRITAVCNQLNPAKLGSVEDV